MAKKIFMILFLAMISITNVFAFDYFFDGFPHSLRRDLAEAYSNVADKYAEYGKDQKAEQFRAMADALLDFEEVEGTAEMASDGSREEKAVLYHFDKLQRALFSENKSSVLNLMANKVYIPLREDGMTLDEMDSELDYFFANTDFTNFDPDEIFLEESISIESISDGFYKLDIEIADQYIPLLQEMTFWNKYQSYYFKEFENGWKVTAFSGTGG